MLAASNRTIAARDSLTTLHTHNIIEARHSDRDFTIRSGEIMLLQRLILCLFLLLNLPGITGMKSPAAIEHAVCYETFHNDQSMRSQNADDIISISSDRSEKEELIKHFAVSEHGKIACGYADRKIDIYDESLVFQLELSINYSASYAISWNGDNLIVLVARIDKLIEVAPNGKVIRIESMNDTREQENDFYDQISYYNSLNEFRTGRYIYRINRSNIFWKSDQTVWITRENLTDGSVETILSSTKADIPLIIPAITFVGIISLIIYEIIARSTKQTESSTTE